MGPKSGYPSRTLKKTLMIDINPKARLRKYIKDADIERNGEKDLRALQRQVPPVKKDTYNY